MNLQLRTIGITEFTARLQTRMKIGPMLSEFMNELGADMTAAVKARTPTMSGNLAESITMVHYSDTVVITTPVVYGTYIETGERHDSRVGRGRDRRGRFSTGVVFRKAGPALMFFRTYNEFQTYAAGRVQELWNNIASIWMG